MTGLRSSAAVGAVLLSISYSLSLFNRTAGTVLVVALTASFSRSLDEVAAIATVFFWVYAMLQIPAGVLADVLGPRRLAVLGGLVTGVGSLAFAAAQNLGTAVYARGLVAAGCSVVFVSLMRHIRTNWPARRVATLSGRGILIGNLGAVASAAPLSFMLGFLDWRTIWVGIGVVSFAGACILWLVMADAHEPQNPRERLSTVGEELRAVVSNPDNHIGFLLLAGLSGTYYALASLWAVPMLTSRGVPAQAAALCASALIVGYAFGACALGWAGDRTSRRWTLATACLGASLCWGLLASNVDSGLDSATFGLLLFALGFWSGGFNLVYALVAERNPLEHAGTVTAYINIGIFVGSGLIQLSSTTLYAATGGDYSKVLVPMVLGSLLTVFLSLSLFYRASRVREKTQP
jgi:MFS family permease